MFTMLSLPDSLALLLLSYTTAASPFGNQELHEARHSGASTGPSAFHSLSPTNASNLGTFSPSQMHSNVMSSYPSHLIITSDILAGYLQANHFSMIESQASIYLSDIQSWITLPESEPKPKPNTTLLPREPPLCGPYTQQNLLYTHSFWGPWHAVSECTESMLDPAGGSVSIGYSDSYSVSYDLGLNPSAFKGAIGASIGFGITFGYSISSTWGCNVAYKDKAQVWARNIEVWSEINSAACSSCTGKCGAAAYGWVVAAADSANVANHNKGCSAKSKSPLKGC